MLRSILIALDGSENTDAVVDLGIRWTQQLNTNLTAIGVVDQPTMRNTAPAPSTPADTSSMEGHWKEEEDRLRDCLLKFEDQCRAVGVDASCLEDVGPPAERILLESNRHDLVLLSPHFQTTTSAGDTFSKVLQSTARPVVAVPQNLGSGEAIVIAYDGSIQASRALRSFVATGLSSSIAVHVVSIHDDIDEATNRCAVAVCFLDQHGTNAKPHALKASGQTADQLLSEVAALEANLLVLGAHKKPVIKEFFLGSVTKTILGKSTIPLFLDY